MGRGWEKDMLGFLLVMLVLNGRLCSSSVSKGNWRKIAIVNKRGPYVGIVVPNSFEMNPLLQSTSFEADHKFPHIDILGRRFRVGKIESKKIIIVMTGLSMLNAGLSTQLLLSLFRVEGVVHYGIAGNANSHLQIGDVTIPKYWAHTGLWNWQRFGDGPNDALAFEINGDYTRRIGYLKFANYDNSTKNDAVGTNLLNNVWFQPEEIFPVNGIPEVRQHAFWISVDMKYYAIAKKLKDLKLSGCVDSTNCLPRLPIVTTVERGISGNVFVDNKAYREFLNSKFNATPIDMESAAVALVCLQLKRPFIAIRALSDLAGGGSSLSNESAMFASLAVQNAIHALIKFMAFLS